MKRVGVYIVGQGKELGCRKEHWEKWIVTDEHGTVAGHYYNEDMAMRLAETLDRIRRIEVDDQIDQILRQK
jgi:hypothetical protein